MRAFLLGLLLAASPALAQEATGFVLGQTLNHNLSVCTEKSDALAIVNTEAAKGRDAAEALWMLTDKCDTAPVVGPTVGSVVHSVSVVREGKKLTMRVVEIKDSKGVVIGYFLSALPIVATLELAGLQPWPSWPASFSGWLSQ